MTNAQFIADHRVRRYRAGGLTAAATEVLLTCPLCLTSNFSARGLAAHCCRAKPDRERLSAAELSLARDRAAQSSQSK